MWQLETLLFLSLWLMNFLLYTSRSRNKAQFCAVSSLFSEFSVSKYYIYFFYINVLHTINKYFFYKKCKFSVEWPSVKNIKWLFFTRCTQSHIVNMYIAVYSLSTSYSVEKKFSNNMFRAKKFSVLIKCKNLSALQTVQNCNSFPFILFEYMNQTMLFFIFHYFFY